MGGLITAAVAAAFELVTQDHAGAWSVAGHAAHFGVVGAVCAAVGTASSQFLLARMALAATGRMPWQSMEFLRDAAARGALRQVGGAFQFRHALLRDRLVGLGPPDRPILSS